MVCTQPQHEWAVSPTLGGVDYQYAISTVRSTGTAPFRPAAQTERNNINVLASDIGRVGGSRFLLVIYDEPSFRPKIPI